MELSEAKDILKKLQTDDEKFSIHLELTGENSTYFNGTSKKFIKEAEAIDTVLKALEEYEKQMDLDYVDSNFVPKEKIEKKIDEIEKAYEDSKDENGKTEYYYPGYTIDILQELLEGN